MLTIYSYKFKLVDWPLAFLLASITGFSSFLGGYLSIGIPPVYLKIVFSLILLVSALMLFMRKRVRLKGGGLGVWVRRVRGKEYKVYVFLIVFPIALIAFLAGMVGTSGGGLIVPLLIILGGTPLRIAIGTNTFLVLTSSMMGFLGHLVNGGVNWRMCLLFGLLVLLGSQIGSRLHVRVSEENLRKGLASILTFASLWMLARTLF